MDEYIALPDAGEQVSVSGGGQERHRRAGYPRIVLQVGTLEAGDLREVGEIQEALDAVDLFLAGAEPDRKPLQHPFRHRLGDFEPNDIPEAATLELELDRLEQVVGLVRDVEVGVARDPEGGTFGDLHLREEQCEEVRDGRLEGNQEPSVAHIDEARQPFGYLHAREALLSTLGIPDEHRQAQRQSRDVREGLSGTDGERREHRIDVALESLGQLTQLGLVAFDHPREDDPLLLEGGTKFASPQLRLLPAELEDPLPDLGQRGLRRAAVRRPDTEP